MDYFNATYLPFDVKAYATIPSFTYTPGGTIYTSSSSIAVTSSGSYYYPSYTTSVANSWAYPPIALFSISSHLSRHGVNSVSDALCFCFVKTLYYTEEVKDYIFVKPHVTVSEDYLTIIEHAINENILDKYPDLSNMLALNRHYEAGDIKEIFKDILPEYERIYGLSTLY